ncbi:hypothetical protein [Paractinoplanes globisporus]|uniref:Uncharacterized protein n=1 Tax=Paractinoplanes globisporus TaxID=113565 RepID=A0ABW6WEP8_9ACTN|nr:hypothetical protein [Actinoplanes globisporus]
MGDFPSHVVSVPARPRFGRTRAGTVGVFALVLCLMLAGGSASPVLRSPAFLIAGMRDIPSAPTGQPWTPAPLTVDGLRMVASTQGQRFLLHTAAGDKDFLPGVDLGDTTPGHVPGDPSISAAQYRAWFAAMSLLGIRVVRIYTIHRPAFYQQLAGYNRENPDRPLYLMQGVALPTDAYIYRKNLYDKQVTQAFKGELKDAAKAVSGELTTTDGAWDTDVTPWLAGWIIGTELDPYAIMASDRRNRNAKPVSGRFFRSTAGANPTERWLAARMNELAGYQAAKGLSEPIAFVNWPTTDPLRHPQEPLKQEDLYQLDANHVAPTSNWPAGTFASYHAFPYYPDFLRREPGLQKGDPYAEYLTTLHKHHATMPTMVTEFGVPSSIGSAHYGPLGRDQGEHSETDATRIDGELLRLIKDRGLAGGFLFEWADEWYRLAWNTITHQDASRRQLWHDPLTNEQWFGLLATDPGPLATETTLLDGSGGWPAQRVSARVDESFLHLDVKLGDSPPGSLRVGFDVLPSLSGTPMTGSADRRPDAIFALNLVGKTGQAYVREQLDPIPLDQAVPESQRGPAPDGWRAFELLVDRAKPIELQNAGLLRHGVLWEIDKDELTVRVPWSMLAFADPSSHEVGVPRSGKLTFSTSPGVGVSLSASGTDQVAGQVTWSTWNVPLYTERLKSGASAFRDAALSVTGG